MSLSDPGIPFAVVRIDEPGKPLRFYRVEEGDALWPALLAMAAARDAEAKLAADWQHGGTLPTSLAG